ncbi:lipid-binding protein [Pedobacter sp. HMWF019]|uniref:START domain-containing protein n=1 Tax=Pedobacter sp. HMWF019 TaxID=2056856 RepID=UPI000D340F6B|nr:START domain-containing protein [Pedobacter sp. HMWF019]PTS98980.1 lipid-binding protein [Pedobacter sp. HMWF019]
MYKNLFLSVLLFWSFQPVFAQKDWKLNKEKENIKIYTGNIANSKIKAIKVECEFDARASEIVALLLDVESAPDWIYHTKSCKLVKRVSPSELYYYSEVSVPWPVENRDFVAHLTVSQNQHTKVITIDGPAVSGHVPIKKGVVRINNSTGKWIIIPESDHHIRVEYTLHVDPGGALPSWLVNLFATEGPLHIFRELKVQLQKPVYKNAQFAFIKD